jgi:hypothetical protein
MELWEGMEEEEQIISEELKDWPGTPENGFFLPDGVTG